MQARDYRGSAITGGSGRALETFERALAQFQSWRGNPAALAEAAVQEAPGFVMAHVLQACLQLCSRDPASADAARATHARAIALPANARERLHLEAVGAAVADDYDRAKSIYDTLLAHDPYDVLALQVAHAFDYLTGDTTCLSNRAARVLPAWSSAMPGYHAVLAIHAFGLEECGQYEQALEFAQRALAINELDARAYHTQAHVFEMTGHAEDGLRWMQQRKPYWAADTMVATHCWWHMALFNIEMCNTDGALSLYDLRVRPTPSPAVADMIDASALLWRVALRGGDIGRRGEELASAWAPRIADGFCTFNDLHAMMAFAIAEDWASADRLVAELSRRQFSNTRHGETSRLVGLPACRALLAFARGDCVNAVALLGGLPGNAHRLGGSHAQRDVLHLTLVEAVERIRGRRRRLPIAA